MKLSTAFLSLLSLVPLALAQSAEWGQCGGIGWSGATSCVSGTICTVLNPYYSQCLPSTNAPPPPSSTAQPAPTSTQPAGTPTSTAGGGAPIPTTGLDAAAKAAGKKYFGTASDSSEFDSDAQYASILGTAGEFGALTPLNSMKWDTTEPSRGNFNFAPGDQLVAEAKKNGQIVRGHNCVWYNQLPSWVSDSGFNAATLTSVVQTHCSSLVSHFKGEISYFLITGPLTSLSDAWDVINEPFNDDGTWRSDVFYNVLGTNYVQIALNAARAADPNAKLYINDYNIESPGAKATAMINLVKSLKSAGVPIDGVGFQGHFIVGEVPTSLQSVLEQVTALGVEVAITELDIRMPVPASAANLAQQQRDYQSVVRQCNAVAGCIGVTIWDFTDKYSWVPNTFSGQGAALPWDQNYQKKLAYTGAISGF